MDMYEVRDTLSRSVEGTEALDNRQRAIAAFHALETFAKITGTQDESIETVMIDMLSNLLHLVDATGISFPDVWQTAVGHHAQEMRADTAAYEALHQAAREQFANEPLHYRCPECDTYSGTFTPSDDGYMSHSICGREGLVSSFTPGTQEYEDAYESDDE